MTPNKEFSNRLQPSRPSIWSNIQYYIECGLAILIIAEIGLAGRYFFEWGFLPDPFFYDPIATFTDWYDPAFWAHNPGAYDVYGSVYPPMSYAFLYLFSEGTCYRSAAPTSYSIARYCDPLGIVVLTICLVLGFILSYLSFRRENVRAALPRAIAVGVGCPMLWALERGNLIVPAFVFFVLAYGRLLRSGWLKAVCAAITIGFKPYLLIAAFGRILRRDWRWSEALVISVGLIWAASYAFVGSGSPMEVVHNIIGFSGDISKPTFNSLHYTTSFYAIDQFIRANPVTSVIGSRPVEADELWVPLVRLSTGLMTFICVAATLLKPRAIPATRVGSLIMIWYYVYGGPGFYALGFILFLVFLENWKGVSGFILLLASYLWCVPWDKTIYHIGSRKTISYLSGQTVNRPINLQASDFAGPALMLIMELAILSATFRDLWCAWLRSQPPVRATPTADSGTGRGI